MTIQPSLLGNNDKVDLSPTDLVRKYRNAYPHIHEFDDLLAQMMKGEFRFWSLLHDDIKLRLLTFMQKVTDCQRRFQEMEADSKAGL